MKKLIVAILASMALSVVAFADEHKTEEHTAATTEKHEAAPADHAEKKAEKKAKKTKKAAKKAEHHEEKHEAAPAEGAAAH